MPPKLRKSKRLRAAIMGNTSATVDDSETQSPSVAPLASSGAGARPSVSASNPIITESSGTKALSASTATPYTAAKDDASVVWTGLSVAFRRLQLCSSAIPPLNPIVSSLSDCLDALSDKDRRRHEYRQLASDLTTIVDSLGQHMVKSNSTQMSQSAQNLVNAIQEQINHVAVKQQRRTLSRYAEAAEDEEDLIERYRQIESYFRQLQLDAMMSVWSNTNEQLAIMRLSHLAPAKQARYNSAQAVVVRRRMCTLGTRTSIRRELRDWADNPDSPKVYWLNGMAGTGKTTIAYSFCDELEQSFQLGASFFCSRLLPECRDMNTLVPTIAYQLASFSSAFRSALCDVLSGNHDLSSYNLETQFTRLLRDPLRTVQDSVPTNAVIVVDALDELSNNNDARAVLDTLFRHVSDLPVRFFVTSRPEHGIRDRMLSRDNQSRRIMYLHDIERSLVQADIELYLQDELKSICQSQDQIRQLAEQAGSLFIYAATAVRYIIPENLSANHEKRLETMLQMSSDSSGRKHRDIDALYTAILAGTLDSSDLEPDEADDIRLVLYAAVCVKEPLNVKALASLLGLGHERRALSSLQPLRSVLYVSESTGMVSTLHASFPDFLLSASRSGVFHCNEARTNGVLAARCFGTMEKMLRFNICDLESSYVFDVDVPNLDNRISQAVLPELVYACRYWGSHLGATTKSEALRGLLEQFLSIRLLFWMEVLSLKRCIGPGEAVLYEAQKWLETCGASSDALKLIKDARKFVTAFAANPISQSTPHLYVSALPFWRKETPISVHYWKKTRGFVQIDGTVTSWNASAVVATWPTDTTVYSIAFSPSGNHLACGSDDGTVRVWDFQTGTVVSGPFEGHTRRVSAIAFSSDGTRIASGSRDCTIRVWDVQGGALLNGSFEGHTKAVYSVAFSPDDSYIVSGSGDCTIRVWDSRTGVLVAGPFQGHTGKVHATAFSPDGARVISGSKDGTIRVWDAQTGSAVSEPFKIFTGQVRFLVLSPNGTLAASLSRVDTIDVWDTRTGTRVSGPFGRPTRCLARITFSRDGTELLSVTNDRVWLGHTAPRIRVWDVRTGTLTSGPFEGHTSVIHAAAFSPNGTRIVSCSGDKTIRVWDAEVGHVAPSPFGGPAQVVSSVAFSVDGTHIVSGTYDGTFCVRDVQSGQRRSGPFTEKGRLTKSMIISSDGTRVARNSFRGLSIWDAQTGAKLSGPFKIDYASSVAFSPDGTRIASIDDRTIRVWDAQNGFLISTSSEQHTSRASSIAFSPDGARIVSGYRNHTIRIWDTDTGTLSRPFQGYTGSVHALAFSLDGNLVASGSADGIVCVWDASAGTMASGPFEGHTDPVNAVVFSPDGTRVVSGSKDSTVRIWNVQTGALMFAPLEGHTDSVTSIALSPDGTRIASGSDDTTIRIWDTKLMGSFKKDDWRLGSNGWITTGYGGELLLWIPPGLRNRLHLPQKSTVVCAWGSFKPRFDDSLHGIHWSKCYTG